MSLPEDPKDRFTRWHEGIVSKTDNRLESSSGSGSNTEQTQVIRDEIPNLLKRLGIKTMLDAPCGDFNWMQYCALPEGMRYIGVEIVSALVAQNRQRHAAANRVFEEADIITSDLPRAELILCRDCLVHLSHRQCVAALRNFRRSGATYLLCTTFTGRTGNYDLDANFWRPLNLQAAPFGFPEPQALIVEGCTELGGRFADKSLGLWRLSDLPDTSAQA